MLVFSHVKDYKVGIGKAQGNAPAGTNKPVKADARQRYAVQPPDMDSWPEPSISSGGAPRGVRTH